MACGLRWCRPKWYQKRMTTSDDARYAIYFVPAAQMDLYRFGCSILGYDCYTGSDIGLLDGLDREFANWREITQEPRRYGFHATLKAPFRLPPSCSEAALTDAFDKFTKLDHPVAHIELEITAIGDFIAIVPRRPTPALDALANQCTTSFDAFRAPMTAKERARRTASHLSPSQMQNLDRWGYPFVFEDFRFHMTLTGLLPNTVRDHVIGVLRRAFDRMCGNGEFAVDRLALVKQPDEKARFRVLRQAEVNR
jgi:putative phosphonate metabolism protein